ncbi:TetR/AcrR family transcriptional regulator [Singulisphaera sp. PoT]|uniref:TetR/AcrR family transcriptional regulator n=1 Tax=Singulisphaera sp. PoT TaxID=3411797 RepID=UPI003BF4D5C8
MEAALSLFAEKSYDAVTMTEVAARAGAPIGSLYQFFPSKESLAEALLERFGEQVVVALGAIEERAAAISLPELAELLLRVLPGMQQERAVVSTLLESRQDASARALELRLLLRRYVTRILRVRAPELPLERVEAAALLVIQLMKAAARVDAENEAGVREVVLGELKEVMVLYLNERLGAGPGVDGSSD